MASIIFLWLSKLATEAHATLKHTDDAIVRNVAEPCDSTQKVLLFWAVGQRQEVRTMVHNNIKQMHLSLHKTCWDVFLHHYNKGGKIEWYLSDPSWYDQEVHMSAEGPGFKFQLLKEHFLATNKDDWTMRYKYVWALDEDIDFSKASLADFFRLVKFSQAAIAGPSLIQPSGQLRYGIQAPNEHCSFRYTNFVEVIAPVISTDALRALVVDCKDCIHRKTVWGLDNVWCGFVANQLSLSDRSTACVILDDVPVIHRDFRTLKGKYSVPGAAAQESTKFRSIGNADAADIQKRYPTFFVADNEGKTLRCIHSQRNSSADRREETLPAAGSLAHLEREVDF